MTPEQRRILNQIKREAWLRSHPNATPEATLIASIFDWQDPPKKKKVRIESGNSIIEGKKFRI